MKIRRHGNDLKKISAQLIETEREGKPALVHKLSKALSGRSGPKTRNHRAARGLRTCGQWKKELAAGGRRGEMSAVQMEQEKWISTATFEEKEEPFTPWQRDSRRATKGRWLHRGRHQMSCGCNSCCRTGDWYPTKRVGACQKTLETQWTSNGKLWLYTSSAHSGPRSTRFGSTCGQKTRKPDTGSTGSFSTNARKLEQSTFDTLLNTFTSTTCEANADRTHNHAAPRTTRSTRFSCRGKKYVYGCERQTDFYKCAQPQEILREIASSHGLSRSRSGALRDHDFFL